MPSWTQLVPLLAVAASSAVAHQQQPVRKSLSFGPSLSHASYITHPAPLLPSLAVNGDGDKESIFQMARSYVKVLGHAEGSYRVRDDSYRDPTTGIWHVYLRQTVLDGALEVADGDINLNILDGNVISHGDSFYRGPTPVLDGAIITPARFAPATQVDSYDQAYYCSQLRTALTVQISADAQVPMSSPVEPHTERLRSLYESNCVGLHALDPAHYSPAMPNEVSEAKDAALYFLIASHPSAEVSQSILTDFKAHRDRVSSHFENNVHGVGFPTEFLSDLPGTVSPVKATPVYVQNPCAEDACVEGQTSTLTLVWRLEVEMEDNWYEAYVDAFQPTRIVSVVDWVSDASPKCWPTSSDDLAPIPKLPKEDENGVRLTTYRVWPWGVNDPTEGHREIVKSPYDVTASPIGWHAIPSSHNPSGDAPFLHSGEEAVGSETCNFTTTWGNNVQAQENWEGRNTWLKNSRPEGHSNLTFVFRYGAGKKHDNTTVDPKSYIDLSITQLFFTTNMVHDLYYRYGFDEVAGNFQNYNFGKGGKEDDAVIANAQDGSGFNNANFATPPDGQRGKMRMYVWDVATPWRDGDLEAGIVIHELSHGLSTRLTGGPANSGCLGWGESGGMGEGWGDFLATTIRSTANYSDFAMGAWAANREKGIRNYIYSTDMKVNPSTYKTLDGPGYWGVHAIGEVWAEILWVVSQNLIKKHGFTESLFPPQPTVNGSYIYPNDFYAPPIREGGAPIPKHGNSLMVQLVLNGMKLQPCSPKFFSARDAILQADEVLTGGANTCELWQGFASRGLGPNADLKGGTPWGGGIRKNDFALPVRCAAEDPEEPEE